MGTITLSVPDELKERMSKVDWVNWSSIARRAFSSTLGDVEELETRRKVLAIGGIPEDDNREVRKELADDVVKSIDETLRSEKPMTLEELDELMGLESEDLEE